KVTGAFDPNTYNSDPKLGPLVQPTPGELDALRYLAQLAVNVVDFIDNDDYITPFHWGNVGSVTFRADHGSEWVFGTELPKAVINEAYAEIVNDPNEPTMKLPLGQRHATTYFVDVWAELCNPFRLDGGLREGGTARLHLFPTDPANP